MHFRFTSRSVSLAQRLHNLATQLQPVLCKWREVARDPALDAAERRGMLRQLEKQAQRANRSEFLHLIERLCRSYCSRKKVGSHPCFDLELFIEEVKLLALSRIEEFDPTYPFQCWFTSYILLPVYKSVGRSVVVTWEQRTPKTAQGRFARWQALQVLTAQSMEGPAYRSFVEEEHPTVADLVPDEKANPENEVLERDCRERFVQALRKLNETEQTLLTRICLNGELQKQVAQTVGLTPGRISQKLKQIYEKLACTLGDHFDRDCAQTSFCQGWWNEMPPGPGKPAAATDPVGCRATLLRAIPDLVRRSGWPGVIPGDREVADAQEQALLEELFGQPSEGGFGGTSWTLVAAMAAAMVAVWVGSGGQQVLQKRAVSEEQAPPLARLNEPVATPRKTPPPEVVRRSPHGPAERRPQRKAAATTARTTRTGSVKRPTPQPPALIAATPQRARTQPLRTPVPEIITRTMPDAAGHSRQVQEYAGRLCASLSAVAPLDDQPLDFVLLEVVLAVQSGQVALQEGATQVLVPGDSATADFWREALQRVTLKGLPPWSREAHADVHYYISIDINQRQWVCQPVLK
jgi:RNA polymerase sigma factor (sigma-70 family)